MNHTRRQKTPVYITVEDTRYALPVGASIESEWEPIPGNSHGFRVAFEVECMCGSIARTHGGHLSHPDGYEEMLTPIDAVPCKHWEVA